MIIVEVTCTCGGGGNRLTLKPNVRLGTPAERVPESIFSHQTCAGTEETQRPIYCDLQSARQVFERHKEGDWTKGCVLDCCWELTDNKAR